MTAACRHRGTAVQAPAGNPSIRRTRQHSTAGEALAQDDSRSVAKCRARTDSLRLWERDEAQASDVQGGIAVTHEKACQETSTAEPKLIVQALQHVWLGRDPPRQSNAAGRL